jgi:formamidopyrimidine-DNA glycosylase
MPELPDVELYLSAMRPRIVGEVLERIRLVSPFLQRSVAPPVDDVVGRRVAELRRIGKRIVWALEGDRFVVIHPMIAGRFKWTPLSDGRPAVPGKVGLAAFDFSSGTVLLTEASARKRASLYLVHGEAALAEHDPGGLDVLTAGLDEFAARLHQENRTLKRALTDPRLFSGIGNAYSDEILHAAQLSPTQLTGNLEPEAVERLLDTVREVLLHWTRALIAENGDGFPAKVTAFRLDMAVHGKFGKPCPRCGSPVQRISYAANECNYCATCQTGGRLLADRGLSRLLGKDWPKTLEELEDLKRR